jgi:hypothetical protein
MAGLKNGPYNTIKIIHELCSLSWFIEKHAKQDYKNALDEKSLSAVIALQKDLEKYIEQFSTLLRQ